MPQHLRNRILSCILVLGALSASAQDIHFSQFYQSPIYLNPAMTGVMNCNNRLIANFRNQWASVLRSNAYNTYSISYDQKVPVGRNDYLGVGANFWGDKAGSVDFKTLNLKASVSFSKRMGGSRRKAHYLVVGADAGVLQRSVDLSLLRWGTQHDGKGGFDPTLPTYEPNWDRDQFFFADIDAGLLWFTVNKNNNYYIGGAFSHVNRANVSFSSGKLEPLYSKYTLHAGAEYMFNSQMGLLPGVVLFRQGPSFQVNTGASLKFNLGTARNYQAFLAGIWGRLSNTYNGSLLMDAIILHTRFDYDQFLIGFSYDLNVSSLHPASSYHGAFEFALQYKICGPERRNVYCPNF